MSLHFSCNSWCGSLMILGFSYWCSPLLVFQVLWTRLWGILISTWRKRKCLQEIFGAIVSYIRQRSPRMCSTVAFSLLSFVRISVLLCLLFSVHERSLGFILLVLSVPSLTGTMSLDCSEDESISLWCSPGKDESGNQVGTGGRFWRTL